MKKVLTVIIAGALAASICAVTAGCGGNSSSNKAATTVPSTSPSTSSAAATAAADGNQTQQDRQQGVDNQNQGSQSAESYSQSSAGQEAQNNENQNNANQDSAAGTPGISAEEASKTALSQQSSAFRVASCTQGTDESGSSVWVVRLTADAGGADYVYYVKSGSCVLAYVDNSNRAVPERGDDSDTAGDNTVAPYEE